MSRGQSKEYLGDGVYVEFDGEYVRLSTQREHGEDEIFLDSEVLEAFVAYLKARGLMPGKP